MHDSSKSNATGPLVGVDEYERVRKDQGETSASRLLFTWLSDDDDRAQLYRDMVVKRVALAFESRAALDDTATTGKDEEPKAFRQTAYLLVHPDHLEAAYKQSAELPDSPPLEYSNSPFEGLGGTFMLAIDEQFPAEGEAPLNPFRSHDRQRSYCFDLLKELECDFSPIATIAFKAGALLPLKQREFDLAQMAELIAVYYVALLFGFPQADLPMLQATARKIGKGLQYQMMARHFVHEPAAIVEARQALAAVSQRAAQLIDVYDRPIGREQADLAKALDDELRELWKCEFEDPRGRDVGKRKLLKAGDHRQCLRAASAAQSSAPSSQAHCRDHDPRQGFLPLMRLMATCKSDFSTTEKSILVAGLVGGAITNIRAAISIAVQQFFRLDAASLQTIAKDAVKARAAHRDANWSDPDGVAFRKHVEEAMRVNPPAAFLPRKAAIDLDLPVIGNPKSVSGVPNDSLIVLGVGGGCWTESERRGDWKPDRDTARFRMDRGSDVEAGKCPFSMVFGGPPHLRAANGRPAAYTHSCFGMDLAMHVIAYTVRQVMVLPGLTQTLDPETGRPRGLTKNWGYYSESYPLEYQRERLLRQSPLQTVLNVKNPVPEHAEALKRVIQFGAPFIEKVLREAKHVHFASFIFLDNDSKLVLFTAYDGDYDAYIGHFAREFGPLFDRFFSHIEDGPRSPISEHAFEFVQFLRRFQKPSAGGYFFSAYPEVMTHQIVHQFDKLREYDFGVQEYGK